MDSPKLVAFLTGRYTLSIKTGPEVEKVENLGIGVGGVIDRLETKKTGKVNSAYKKLYCSFKGYLKIYSNSV